MVKNDDLNTIIATCHIRNVVARFGDKWSLIPLIMQLTEWAQANIKNVMTHRWQYESLAKNS